MFRTSILASLLMAFSSIAVFAEDALQLTCSGTMIEPSALSPSPETVSPHPRTSAKGHLGPRQRRGERP
jgi:hypothetical protein